MNTSTFLYIFHINEDCRCVHSVDTDLHILYSVIEGFTENI